MNRLKKITPITEEDFQKVINNSVMGEGSRLVGSAAEQKKLFVKPIAAIDDGENVMQYVQRLAEETEETIEEIEEEIDRIADEAQTYYDERLETEGKNVPDAINELLGIANKKVTKETVPNRIYGTDAHGRPKMYELNEVGDIIGGESEIGDIFQFVQARPQEGMKNVLYFVLKTDGEDKDLFDEWVWANKGTSEEPIYDWEFVGTKKISIDTSLFVKFTDIATNKKAGVVMVTDAYGMFLTGLGEIAAHAFTIASYEKTNNYCFISKGTLENIKYDYVKGGLVDSTEEWAEEDKAAACETIGAFPYVDNDIDGDVIIPCFNRNTNKYGYKRAYGAYVGQRSIVMRDSQGRIYGKTPIMDNEFAIKEYVDDNKGTKLYLHEIACDGAIVGGGNDGTNVLYTVFIVNALASIDSVFNALNVPVLHISVTDEGGNYMVLDIMREGSTIYLGILNPDGVVYVRVDAELGIETTELSKYGE